MKKAIILLLIIPFFTATVFGEKTDSPEETILQTPHTPPFTIPTAMKKKKSNNIIQDIIDFNLMLIDKANIIKTIRNRKHLYKERTVKRNQKKFRDMSEEGNMDSLSNSSDDEAHSTFVLLAEVPYESQTFGKSVIAPIYMYKKRSIFNSKTDIDLKLLGTKIKLKLKQKKFPWKQMTLNETFIGSFLYASGTNLGFVNNTYTKEDRFYTNYTSQIFVVKWKFNKYFSIGSGIGSRQYFFVKNNTPQDFIMPSNHINIFPRGVFDINNITIKGLDMLTHGIQIYGWAGYRIRNRWNNWGYINNIINVSQARKFTIYSITLKMAYLWNNNHNIVAKFKFKGGINNDFLSQPRYGGTIDNANLDLIHGFGLDEFRVKRFALTNMKYGFNIVKKLRINIFFDYGLTIKPEIEHLVGLGLGIRIISYKGLPIWVTHGVGKELSHNENDIRQTTMIMTAAAW